MSYAINGTTIDLTRGDSFWGLVEMYEGDEIYVPDDRDVIRFVLKRNVMDALKKKYLNATPLIEKIIPNNTLLLYLHPNDTKGLSFGEYVYDIEITFKDGNVDTFINNAIFNLVPEVD